jgi:hypothetical protein
VEAGDYHNPMLLKLEEYARRKETHPCSPAVPVDDRELQWEFRDRLNCGFNRQGETSPNRASNKSSFASGVQTTEIVTVS